MSIYNLLPCADSSGKETNHAWWQNGFSENDITRLITYGNTLVQTDDALIGGPDYGKQLNKAVRRSKIAWIYLNDDTQWIYDRLGFVIRRLNGEFFQFDISGFAEPLQYTTYESSDLGFYDWHMDKGYLAEENLAPRKLSLTVQLSDPSEYEGGDLELMTGSETVVASKEKGIVHIFPSYVMHRVTPVTRGTRRSLVIWIAGPKFR